MRYLELKEKLKNFTIFSLSDIRKIENNFDRRRLNEWQGKGYIKKLRRGYYIFSNTFLNEEVLFLIANKLYSPSYVSSEMALSFYGLIPEGVYHVTSISTLKTENFKTPIAEFSYRMVKPELFFGYQLVRVGNQQYKIAEIEKTVLDFLYLNPQMSDQATFFEWRFNSKNFLAKADMIKFSKYLNIFKNKRLAMRVNKFIQFIKKK